MNKNTDPVFIQEIQRMDPCAAHTSPTLQPRRSTESTGVILIIFCREVLAKEGNSLPHFSSLTLLSSILPTRVTSRAHLATPSAYLCQLRCRLRRRLRLRRRRRHCSWSGLRYQPDLWASTFRLVEKHRRYSRGEGRGERRGEEGRRGRGR